jgi:GntR family transcriptional regulator, rspAB operon transcriptional repressor
LAATLKLLARNKPRKRTEAGATSASGGASKPAGGQVTLTEHVYQAMKYEIVTGVLAAGTSVTEKDLAERYDASRTPVREAALRLHHEDLLRIVPNCGYFISAPTVQEVNDMYEYRAAIESACAELVARRGISPPVFDKLMALAETECKSNSRADYAKFIQADTAFHVGIARLTQNALMVRAVTNLRCHADRILFAATTSLEPVYYGELPAREHSAILQAIRSGDPELSRKLVWDHILAARQRILQLPRNDFRLD